jgi:hypothetical protein
MNVKTFSTKSSVLSRYFFYLFLLQASLLSCSEIFCENTESKLLLITGCGRSGTEYMSRLLRQSGYDIKHEKPGAIGSVSWPMAVALYSPWGPASKDQFQYVFHQVRNPLKVITSWFVNLSSLDRDEWKFIRFHIPEILEDDPLIVQCAKYWYYWNLKVEQVADWRYQIEHMDAILDEFQFRSGLILNVDILNKLPHDINKWGKINREITWNELEIALPTDLYNNLQEMAIRYGYAVED